jgi:hypothetical protein
MPHLTCVNPNRVGFRRSLNVQVTQLGSQSVNFGVQRANFLPHLPNHDRAGHERH